MTSGRKAASHNVSIRRLAYNSSATCVASKLWSILGDLQRAAGGGKALSAGAGAPAGAASAGAAAAFGARFFFAGRRTGRFGGAAGCSSANTGFGSVVTVAPLPKSPDCRKV